MAELTPFGSALAGAFGGVISNSIVYPLDTVKTRIQADAKSTGSTVPPPSVKRDNAPRRLHGPVRPGMRLVFKQILKEQGIEGFYRGFSASMLNTFSMQFAYFYWYTLVRQSYVKRIYPTLPGTPNTPPKALGTAQLTLGAIAGAIAQLFTIPVSVIATRQQLEIFSTHRTLLETASDILKDDGISGLWRGLKPSLILTVNPAITYGMFARLKTALLGPDGKMTPGKAFIIGALSKTLATVVTFPYIMAKVRLQAKYDDDGEIATPPPTPRGGAASHPSSAAKALQKRQKKKDRYTGAFDVLAQTYKAKGLAGWYQGMQAQIIKAVLSQALLFGIKDMLEAYTIALLAAYGRVRGHQIGLA
ncbi:uncharacterized protein L969DRAFT_50979 [Mixia osmundae IAM 14324]|uniref:uncharacterized protein n=1 Tax=Mixia osmundae (strain CBS 9802 / IAM 14324 / JCM 22182 / KY 12970) TaxID=764103 RepID=UPI0004A55385|nr:uncharacterized protein L969DRAFT_50979 [Mixia osmundae IAM 14324]KEI38600.1 hypothetical protein L969DRAFT_50979 [Mixia osmundae IAM 14324]